MSASNYKESPTCSRTRGQWTSPISLKRRCRSSEGLLFSIKNCVVSSLATSLDSFSPSASSHTSNPHSAWEINRSIKRFHFRSTKREREREMRRSGACVRCFCLVVLAVASALCVSGPALYWRYRKTFSSPSSLSRSLGPFFGSGSLAPFPGFRPRSASACAPCTCDCPPPLSLHTVAPVLANLSITDCGKDDPELHTELGKQPVELLTEELKLHEAVAEEQRRHSNATLADARRLASQYQHEVEKCNMATEACEEARERSAAVLAKERKITALWERRARQLGWQDA